MDSFGSYETLGQIAAFLIIAVPLMMAAVYGYEWVVNTFLFPSQVNQIPSLEGRPRDTENWEGFFVEGEIRDERRRHGLPVAEPPEEA